METFNSNWSSADNDQMEDDYHTPTSHALDVVISAAEAPRKLSPARPLQIQRFLTGLVFAAAGIGLMLCVAVGALQDAGADGKFSLPAVAICMVVGLMLLGGGFGVMATAAPTFDDDEFDRLLQRGSRSLAEQTNNTADNDSQPAPDDHPEPTSHATSVVSDLLEESLV